MEECKKKNWYLPEYFILLEGYFSKRSIVSKLKKKILLKIGEYLIFYRDDDEDNNE
jgi:hypothetical protein